MNTSDGPDSMDTLGDAQTVDTLDDLAELKDFFSAPSDASADPYSLGVAGLSSRRAAELSPPPTDTSHVTVAAAGGQRMRRFGGQGASLFDDGEEEDTFRLLDEVAPGGGGPEPVVAEIGAENRRLRQQLQFMTNELSVKEKRISQLEREVAILRSDAEVLPLQPSSVASSFSASSPQRVLSLDTQGIFGGPNLLESLSGTKAKDSLSSSVKEQEGNSMDRLAECGLIGTDQQNLFTRDVNYEAASGPRGEKAAKEMLESVEEGDFDSSDPHADVMTYQEFLDQLMQPECVDVVDVLRRFISSILGPNGDGSPPSRGAKLDYTFVGTQDIRHRCPDFLVSMEKFMNNHAVWKNSSEAYKAAARDHVEKYLLTKLYDQAFAAVEDNETDLVLLKRMKVLSFITPDALDIKPGVGNDMVWALAQDELRNINKHRSPQDKVGCIVRSCAVIFRSLNLARAKDPDARPGADDFLPIFIYTVLTCNVPKLFSNCEYIHTFRNPNDLMSKSGYCLVNLRSAIEFVLNMDASLVNMDKAEFQAKLQAAEAACADS